MIPKCFSQVNYHGMTMLLLPVILIKMLALMFGISAPGQAVASSYQAGSSHPRLLLSLPRTWTEKQLAASAHIEHLKKLPFGNDPLLYDQDAEDTASRPNTRGAKLSLQMIMSFQSGNVALISSRQYRKGDRIESSPWIVIHIDGDVRSVTLRHEESGEKRTLTVDGVN